MKVSTKVLEKTNMSSFFMLRLHKPANNQQCFCLNSSAPFFSLPKAKHLSLRYYEKINDTMLLKL